MSEELVNTWILRALMGAICVCIALAWGAGAVPTDVLARVCVCTTLLLLVALLWQRLLPLWQLSDPEMSVSPPLEQVAVAIESSQALTPQPSAPLPTRPGV